MKKVQGPTVTHSAGTEIEAWWIKEPFVKGINTPVRLSLKCFFQPEQCFLSQQFSRNSIFQPVSAKFQTSERGHGYGHSGKIIKLSTTLF